MLYAASISALTLASVALAQDVTIHVGSVGGKQALAFDPPSVNATKGSIVTFLFDGIPGNHTVAQSAFGTPCEPLAGGFDSGFIFVPPTTDATTASFPTFNLTIEDDTKPIWFYCAQLNPMPHCAVGMVGAINAPDTGNTFSSFAEVAKAATTVLAPVPALSGMNAFATAAPGPLTGNFSGAAVPTGTLPALASSGTGAASSGSDSGSGTGAPAPTGSNNAAGVISVSGLAAFVAAAFGIVLV